MLQLRFAIVGHNPKVGIVHYLHQCLSGIDELPHVDVLASGYAIGRGHDDGVREVEPGQVDSSLRHLHAGSVLAEAVSLLAAGGGKGAELARQLFVAGLGREESGVDVVILLLRDGFVLEELGIARILAAGVLQLHAGFFDTGIGNVHGALGGAHALRGGLAARTGIGKVGLSLGQTQPELAVLNDDEGVALMDGLVLLETDFLDKTLHAGVDGGDVLANGSVVGELHLPEMDEMVYHKISSAG